jgi:hypothetical protein
VGAQAVGTQVARQAQVLAADVATFNKEKMATHSVSIIDHKQLSDGQLALLAECCGDPSTHSWLTCHAEVVVDDQQFQDSINFHLSRVANLHEAMHQAIAKAKATIGTKVTVTPSASSANNAAPQADNILQSLVGTTRQVDPAAAPTVH